MHLRLILLSLLVFTMLGSCSIQSEKEETHSRVLAYTVSSYPYSVVCTTGMICDLVKNLAGSYAQRTQIISNGIDPHTYIPSRSDIVNIADADIIFYNGLHLEGALGNVLVRLADRKNIVSLAASLDKEDLKNSTESTTDPHIWMDVSLWLQAAESIRVVLQAFDPTNHQYYEDNFKGYSLQLSKLHSYIYEMLQSIPEQSRVLFTSHDAFQYFAEAYDFTVYGIQGISTQSEASLHYINFLVSLILERGISTVFVESSVSPKYMQVLVEGVQSHGQYIENGGSLFADAMGAPNTYEGSYIGMMDYNARTITRSLQGTVPLLRFLD